MYLYNQDAINTAIDEVAERGHPFVFAHQVIANISSLVIHNLFASLQLFFLQVLVVKCKIG